MSKARVAPLERANSSMQVIRVTPNNEEEDVDTSSSSSTKSRRQGKVPQKNSKAFFLSIRFWMIILNSMLVVVSVLLLSGTWISVFTPTIIAASALQREQQFQSIVTFVSDTIREVSMVSDTMKQELSVAFDFRDYDMAEKKMYKLYKTELEYHEGLTVTSYIGDNRGTCFGVINWGGIPTLLNITTEDQKLYFCQDWEDLDYCKRNSTPDILLPKFDMSTIVESCNKFPGRKVFTPSYADPTMPQYTFISFLNSYRLDKPDANGNLFEFYFAFDLTVQTISAYLHSSTEKIQGSSSFIIEQETDYIVASKYPSLV